MPPIPDREYIFENMRQRRMLSMISRGQFFNTPAMKGGIRLNSSGSQAAPSVQASNISFSGISDTQFNVDVDRGDGESILVVVNATGQVDVDLIVNGQQYEVGQDLGSGNIVAYVGNGDSFTVSYLLPDAEYNVHVFEANGLAYNKSSATNNPATQSTIWSPLAIPGVFFFIDDSNSKTLFQEQDNDNPEETPAAADNDSVGFIYDVSPSALMVTAPNNSRRPILSSDLTRKRFIRADGTDDYISIINSQKYLSPFHKVGPVWTIMFWARVYADGVLMSFMNSNEAGTGRAGIRIVRTNTNLVNVFITHAIGGQNIASFSTTATFTVADGWKPIRVQINGSGTGTGKISIGDTDETFNVTSNGANVDAFKDLFLFSGSSTTERLNGSMSAITFVNAIVSDDDWTEFKGYNPDPISKPFYTLFQDFDFDQPSKVWADTSKTTPITDETPIALVEINKQSLFGNFNRILQQDTLDARPIWRDNNINGKAAGEWDGTDDTFGFGVRQIRGGAFFEIIICKNTKDDPGSHFLVVSASAYMVRTGPDYPQNVDFGIGEYDTYHLGGATDIRALVHQNKEYNIFAAERNGDQVFLFDNNGEKSSGRTGQGDSGWNGMGRSDKDIPTQGNWWAEGFVTRYIRYNGYLTDYQKQFIIDALKAEYNI